MSPTLLPAAGRSRESSAVRRHRAAPPQPAHRHRCACHDRSDRPPRVERLADDRPHRRSTDSGAGGERHGDRPDAVSRRWRTRRL